MLVAEVSHSSMLNDVAGNIHHHQHERCPNGGKGPKCMIIVAVAGCGSQAAIAKWEAGITGRRLLYNRSHLLLQNIF